MKILIVDFFERSVKGFDSFKCFENIIVDAVKSCNVELVNRIAEPDFTTRRYDNLSDLVLNWEIDVLNEQAKNKARAFDTFDIICLSGDMKTLPWERSSLQLQILLHMANVANKPVLSCGSGAFASMFSISTSGSRCEVINGPIGDSLPSLRNFPKYSKGNSILYSSWLNNEAGDLYNYNVEDRSWIPVCNIGFYR